MLQEYELYFKYLNYIYDFHLCEKFDLRLFRLKCKFKLIIILIQSLSTCRINLNNYQSIVRYYSQTIINRVVNNNPSVD